MRSQNRLLDAVYPIVYLDALVVKIREAGHVRNKAIYVAIGVNMQGQQRSPGPVGGPGGRSQVLAAGDYGVEESWSGRHLHRLRGRIEGIPGGDRDGVSASSGAVVSGASDTGLAELRIVEAAQVVAADLQPIYRASTVEEAEQRLDEFAAKWDGAYPTISQMWRRNWEYLTPFFAYPADIRKVIYTTNAIEGLNMSLEK